MIGFDLGVSTRAYTTGASSVWPSKTQAHNPRIDRDPIELRVIKRVLVCDSNGHQEARSRSTQPKRTRPLFGTAWPSRSISSRGGPSTPQAEWTVAISSRPFRSGSQPKRYRTTQVASGLKRPSIRHAHSKQPGHSLHTETGGHNQPVDLHPPVDPNPTLPTNALTAINHQPEPTECAHVPNSPTLACAHMHISQVLPARCFSSP